MIAVGGSKAADRLEKAKTVVFEREPGESGSTPWAVTPAGELCDGPRYLSSGFVLIRKETPRSNGPCSLPLSEILRHLVSFPPRFLT